MPQMAPISWLELMIMFTMTLMMFNSLNFFIYKPNSPKINPQFKKINIKWKW